MKRRQSATSELQIQRCKLMTTKDLPMTAEQRLLYAKSITEFGHPSVQLPQLTTVEVGVCLFFPPYRSDFIKEFVKRQRSKSKLAEEVQW